MKVEDLHSARMLADARDDLVRRRDHHKLVIRLVDSYDDVTLDPVFVEACRPVINRIIDQRIGAIEHDLQVLGVTI